MNLTGEVDGIFTHVRVALGMVVRISCVKSNLNQIRSDINVALCDVTDMLHEGWWTVTSVNSSDTYTWFATWDEAAARLASVYAMDYIRPGEDWERIEGGPSRLSGINYQTRIAIMQFKEEERG